MGQNIFEASNAEPYGVVARSIQEDIYKLAASSKSPTGH